MLWSIGCRVGRPLCALLAACSVAFCVTAENTKPMVLVLRVPSLNRHTTSSEMRKLEEAVGSVSGVVFAVASRRRGQLSVHFRRGTDLDLVRAVVRSQGYQLEATLQTRTIAKRQLGAMATPDTAAEDD